MKKQIIFFGLFFILGFATAQEVWFFFEATDATFYDQGIVDVVNLGESTFEYTHPPGAPQYSDKIPASEMAFRGSTSLKFNYTSAESGNWRVTIYRNDWSPADISELDSLSFYFYSENDFPASALPLIGLRASRLTGSGDVNSNLYSLSDFNENVIAGQWVQIRFPLNIIFDDSENSELNFSAVKGVIFNQSESDGSSRLIFVDEITAFSSIDEIPVATNFTATGYDSHAELNWSLPMADLTYRIYASFDGGQTFENRGETTENYYLDFVPENARNSTVMYRLVTLFQNNESEPTGASAELRDYSDDELMDLVQRYTFRYFWEGAHQPTGMALERSNGNGITAASGATGMGLMAMIVAHEREYRPQNEVKDRILMILDFLENSERHHGVWSHWYNAGTGQTQPFSPDDDGGDIVETSFVAQGLIALKNYFSGADAKSVQIRETADRLWKEIDWNWYRNGQNVLFWHWSPNVGFKMNMHVRGWNETLITYIMAASSPTYGISAEVYEQGYARNGNMVNPRSFYGYDISLSPDWGGPLFWIHYSHLGINPHGLQDQYASYWEEYVNTAKIHHAYAIDNPLKHENYSDKNWGLTASDSPAGYTAHHPVFNDNGTISPTAALSSMPYTPEESMKALKYFYRERGQELFGKYGPYDAFNDNLGWVQEAYIGIDQGPIVVMIENHRTGLLWNTVMQDEDVQAGLDKLGFQYETVTNTGLNIKQNSISVYPNPATDWVFVSPETVYAGKPVRLRVYSQTGQLILTRDFQPSEHEVSFNVSEFRDGLYFIQLVNGDKFYNAKMLVQKTK